MIPKGQDLSSEEVTATTEHPTAAELGLWGNRKALVREPPLAAA
jgi:hypothetical protein